MKNTIAFLIFHEFLQGLHFFGILTFWGDQPYYIIERVIIIVCLIGAPFFLIIIQRIIIDKKREASAATVISIIAAGIFLFALAAFLYEPFVKYKDLDDPHGDYHLEYVVQPFIAYAFVIMLPLLFASTLLAMARKEATLANVLCYIPYGLWVALAVISGLLPKPGFIG